MKALALIVGLGAATLWVAPPAQGEGLKPYQMVRSLQLVQDRIANGDQAALPMQRKLLEMIDARFRQASADDLADRRNFISLLVYAMSGGNPQTIEATLDRLELDPDDSRISRGITSYLNGVPKAAGTTLEPVDPMTADPSLAAFLALVKGAVTTVEKPREAMRMLDQARLLAPGSLVEEAALRRGLAVAATLGDSGHFVHMATDYVRRFLRSPYASQFADAFVAGVVKLDSAVAPEQLDMVAADMSAEQARVIYLRIARAAAIEGRTALSAYAAARAEGRGSDDPRGELYSGLAKVSSGSVEEAAAELGKIDLDRLSAGDRRLLKAAEAVMAEITAAPASPAGTGQASQESPEEAGGIRRIYVDGATPIAEEPATVARPAQEPETVAAEPISARPSQPASSADPTDTLMARAREKLGAIDDLLKETPQ